MHLNCVSTWSTSSAQACSQLQTDLGSVQLQTHNAENTTTQICENLWKVCLTDAFKANIMFVVDIYDISLISGFPKLPKKQCWVKRQSETQQNRRKQSEEQERFIRNMSRLAEQHNITLKSCLKSWKRAVIMIFMVVGTYWVMADRMTCKHRHRLSDDFSGTAI